MIQIAIIHAEELDQCWSTVQGRYGEKPTTCKVQRRISKRPEFVLFCMYILRRLNGNFLDMFNPKQVGEDFLIHKYHRHQRFKLWSTLFRPLLSGSFRIFRRHKSQHNSIENRPWSVTKQDTIPCMHSISRPQNTDRKEGIYMYLWLNIKADASISNRSLLSCWGKEKGLVKLLRRTPCSVPTAKQSVP